MKLIAIQMNHRFYKDLYYISGLFFREEGGGSEVFGKTQQDNSPKLTKVNFQKGRHSDQPGGYEIDVIASGAMSLRIYSGGFDDL